MRHWEILYVEYSFDSDFKVRVKNWKFRTSSQKLNEFIELLLIVTF